MHKFFGVAVGALLMFGLGATAQAAPVAKFSGRRNLQLGPCPCGSEGASRTSGRASGYS